MGSGQTKDPNVDLYMNTHKQYYVAGQYLEGEVFLNAKANRQYSHICLKLEGFQYVQWTTGTSKHKRINKNSYKNYEHYTLLIDFHGTVQQGQYMFPFSLLLPAMMTGSFFYSKNCFLKYMLRVQLVHKTEEKETQIYEMFLNILEPPRMPIGAISLQNNVNSQCCGCCCSYGTIAVGLNCSKNFVTNGETVQIVGIINNSAGSTDIKEWKIVLQEIRVMVESLGYAKQTIEKSYVLSQSDQNGIVLAGQTKEISFNSTIPNSIVHYTAIGRIVGRYFLLKLYTNYGCCTEPARAALHLVVHSRNPTIVKKLEVAPPANWMPQLFPKLICQQMKPYVYNPLPQLKYLNMPSKNTVVVNTVSKNVNQMNYMGYMPYSSDFVPPSIQGQYSNYNPTFLNMVVEDLQQPPQQQNQGTKPNFEMTQQSLY